VYAAVEESELPAQRGATVELVEDDEDDEVEREQEEHAVASIRRIPVSEITLERLHRVLGHSQYNIIKRLVEGKHLQVQKVTGMRRSPVCMECAVGKCVHRPHRTGDPPQEVGERVVVDTYWPVPSKRGAVSRGNEALVLIMDVFSQYVIIYPVKDKGEAAQRVQQAVEFLERQSKKQVLSIGSDGGAEFLGLLKDYCLSKGIARPTSVAHAHQQNGAAERKLRTVGDSIRTQLQHLVGMDYWDIASYSVEKQLNVNHLVERSVEGKLVSRTPYEWIHRRLPDIRWWLAPGDAVVAHLQNEIGKARPRAVLAVHLGTPRDKKGYSVLVGSEVKEVVSVSLVEGFSGVRETARQASRLGLREWSAVAKQLGVEHEVPAAVSESVEQALADDGVVVGEPMEVVEDVEWLEPAADRDSDYVPSGDEDSDEDVSERDHSDGEAEDMGERAGLGEVRDGAEDGVGQREEAEQPQPLAEGRVGTRASARAAAQPADGLSVEERAVARRERQDQLFMAQDSALVAKRVGKREMNWRRAMRAQMKEVRGTRAQAERYVLFPVRQRVMFTGNPEMLLLPRC
jgi:hypothetical protein